MRKPPSVLFRPERQIVKKEKPTSTMTRLSLSEVKQRLNRLVRGKPITTEDSEINYSDILPLTNQQLSQLRPHQRGRPTLGKDKRKRISIKLDPDLIENLKIEAKEVGTKYQSLIHKILEKHFYKKKRAA